jgi:hypothetical protein
MRPGCKRPYERLMPRLGYREPWRRFPSPEFTGGAVSPTATTGLAIAFQCPVAVAVSASRRRARSRIGCRVRGRRRRVAIRPGTLLPLLWTDCDRRIDEQELRRRYYERLCDWSQLGVR